MLATGLSSNAGGTLQKAAQAAQIAQLEETIADLRSQHQRMQSELVKKETADQNQLQQFTSAKEQASKAEVHVQELEKVLEDQSRQLAVAQVSCPTWNKRQPVPCTIVETKLLQKLCVNAKLKLAATLKASTVSSFTCAQHNSHAARHNPCYLQERLGRGEYNKATTKVLHFKRNPEAIAVEALEQKRCSTLEAENAALKGQLQKLEQKSSSIAGGHADTGSVDSAVKEAQISVLQRQVLPNAHKSATQV